jgi:hypothetical protein
MFGPSAGYFLHIVTAQRMPSSTSRRVQSCLIVNVITVSIPLPSFHVVKRVFKTCTEKPKWKRARKKGQTGSRKKFVLHRRPGSAAPMELLEPLVDISQPALQASARGLSCAQLSALLNRCKRSAEHSQVHAATVRSMQAVREAETGRGRRRKRGSKPKGRQFRLVRLGPDVRHARGC